MSRDMTVVVGWLVGLVVVGEGGLEPPHPFGHRNLNPARLPIPPLARVSGSRVPKAPRSPTVAPVPFWRGPAVLRAARRAYGRGRVQPRIPSQGQADRARPPPRA